MVNRYLIGFAVVILLMLIGIILLFSGGDGKPPAEQQLRPLPDYSDTFAEVSFTQRGIINGEDAHREIRVTVGQFQRRLDIIAGYSGNVIQTQTFSNSVPAYREFLAAIRDLGFLSERKASPAQADPLGKCPLGQLYEFELNDGGEVLSYLWSSSCGNIGTLKVKATDLQKMFKNQITNYNQLVSGVKLN
jgi:hypothetical protein